MNAIPSDDPKGIDRRSFLKGLGTFAVAPSLAIGLDAPKSPGEFPSGRIKVYQTQVSTNSIYFVHPARKPFLKYNHDVDIVSFKGRYVAAWNGNAARAEDVPGQFNYLSLSDDFKTWSEPRRMFSADAGTRNAVESDNQWQPNFINWKNQRLFCAWSDFVARRVFVAFSDDGDHWENVEVPNAPAALKGKACGFPTNHGLMTSKGTMLFPCSVPFTETVRNLVGHTRYAGVLRSEDGGKNWSWSEPIEAISWTEAGENPSEFGGEEITMWEPMLFERADGRIGLLIRNSTAQDHPERSEKPYRMLLHAISSDAGRTWSKARTVEVDTICSRNFAVGGVGSPDSLMMVMNDNNVRVPDRIPHDRYYLSLYFSPVGDPDFLLPGPIVQPGGGTAFYPNGFVEDGRLFVAYTYPPGIHSSVVDSLPDFSVPFLLPRESRAGLLLEGETAVFSQRQSSLGLVLTEGLIRQPELTLRFRSSVDHYNGEDWTLLTVGGVTRAGSVIRAIYDKAKGTDVFQLRSPEGLWLELGSFKLAEWNQFEVRFSPTGFSVAMNGLTPQTLDQPLLRKICFGGLYLAPEWPVGTSNASKVRLDLDTLRLA